MTPAEIVVDSFAGGGGASLGIERALGRSPDIAINHDAVALAMHAVNHPATRHLPHNVWKVDPVAAAGGRSVGLLWASPDCKHFSKAKGAQPVARNIRDLAWVVVRWARQVRPRVICLENVEEFRTWGPLAEDGRPCPLRRGETFRRWVGELRRLGYVVEHRDLRACDFGAPTIRKRLFLVARCDGRPIVWPKPTHTDPQSLEVRAGRRKAWRTAAEIIDWSIPCHSIFLDAEEARTVGVRRPLAEATMARIAKGVKRYVLDAAEPFVVTINHSGDEFRGQGLDAPFRTVAAARDAHGLVAPIIAYGQHGGAVRPSGEPLHTITASRKDTNTIVAPTLIMMGYGERPGQTPRVPGLGVPLRTVVAGGGKSALVAAFLAQHNSGVIGRSAGAPVSTLTTTGSHQAVVSAGLVSLKGADRRASPIEAPHPTVTAQGCHSAELRAFLVKYYGEGGDAQSAADPLHTVPTRARFGLVTIAGEPYEIVDIGMRMLTPRELFRAQGFPDNYRITDAGGRCFTQAEQIRMCGNSVCPDVAAALVGANYRPDEVALGGVREPSAAPLLKEIA